MIRRFGCSRGVVLAVAMLGTAASAQVARPTAPVALVPAPPSTPVVHPNGSVDFRLQMPSAKVVTLSIEGFPNPFPMTKDTAGVWTYTAPHLDPEYYSYTFKVDGLEISDPLDRTVKTSYFRVQSLFLVPGHKPWEVRDVPHGVVHRHGYHSAIVNTESEYYVYTPPGFDPGSKQTYPVLYLLHGYSDDASAWTAMAKANVILDNLIADGKAKPMIMVMPTGYGSMEMITRGWAAWQDPALIQKNFSQFGEALYKEVMPRVKKEYPLAPGRDEHAIAGLSMGGAETLLVGLNHPDDFAYVAGFSAGGIGDRNFPMWFPGITEATGPDFNKRMKLLWISCGSEDGLLAPNQKLIAWLKERKVKPKAVVTPGMHVWPVWRDNLSNLLPLLFQTR